MSYAKQTQRRRTFAIISHPDAGKTTLTEKLLLFSGAIHIAGSVKARKASRHATSDWMEIEKQRGISVASSVMQMVYRDTVINLLDTPGHKDFSEDTYRVLTAVDCALMVIDSGNGVEPQTRQLIEVCRQRNTPIMTFINKLDREGRDPLELLDEVEQALGMPCAPLTWPVGMGKEFRGIMDLRAQHFRVFEGKHGPEVKDEMLPLADGAALDARFGKDYSQAQESMELATGAAEPFSQELFLAAKQTPVFFGSGVNNFGVQEVLDALVDLAPPPGLRYSAAEDGSQTPVQPDDEGFSGVVFKVQANMDPSHRDRIAFVRVASGKFEPGMKLRVQRTAKELRPTSVVTFMSQRREAVDEAYAGDIIGFTTHGGVQLGDTITQGLPSQKHIQYTGLPFFAPELFQTAELADPLKSKQLQHGLQQLGEEGAIQVFKPAVGGSMLLGAIGQLQFEVVQHRLLAEYGVKCRLGGSSFVGARWVSAENDADLRKFMDKNAAKLAYDGVGALAYLLTSPYDLRLTQERHPEITFHALREHAGLELQKA